MAGVGESNAALGLGLGLGLQETLSSGEGRSPLGPLERGAGT